MALFVRRTPSHPSLDAGPFRAQEEANVGSPPPEADNPVAAASDDIKKNSSPQIAATAIGAGIFVLGLAVAFLLFKVDGGPTFKAAEGIGAFALFYVAAQSAERLAELFVPAFEKIPGVNKVALEHVRDSKVAAALSGENPDNPTANAAKSAADAQAAVDQARANRTVVVFGITAALGMMLCGYLDANFLSAVGVTFPHADGSSIPTDPSILLAMAVTGLVVGGGSKGLHDLIGNISKSSSSKDTPPETGGQK